VDDGGQDDVSLVVEFVDGECVVELRYNRLGGGSYTTLLTL